MALGFEESFSVKFPLYDFTSAISSTKSGLSVKIITVAWFLSSSNLSCILSTAKATS